MRNPGLYSTTIKSLEKSLAELLDAAGITDLIPTGQTVLIKPNLVEALAPPITTPVQLTALVVDYLRNRLPDTPILIGEGTGSLQYDTSYPFQVLGYANLASEKNIPLLDLNYEKLTEGR